MKLILLGFGAVGKAILELLPISKLIPRGKWSNILIIEPRDYRSHPLITNSTSKIRYIRKALTPRNLVSTISRYTSEGDILIDVSVDVDAISVMTVCRDRGVIYINTSLENWEIHSPEKLDPKTLYERTLYKGMYDARELFSKTPSNSHPVLVEMGFNPGLISCYCLRGIEDYARSIRDETSVKMMREGKYAKAAKRLGLTTIQITERDTQTVKKNFAVPKDTFVNTWSSVGLMAEFLDPVQYGCGTHETTTIVSGRKTLKPILPQEGPKNIAILPSRGMDTILNGWIPRRPLIGNLRSTIKVREYKGYSIPHGESNTLSYTLTLTRRGKVIYRPSVFFAYEPSPIAVKGVEEMRKNKHKRPEGDYVLSLQDIHSGYDLIGTMLFFKNGRTWWSGSALDVSMTKKLGVKYSGPTVIQVAAGILSALRYLLDRRSDRYFNTPETLNYRTILRRAKPFLGDDYSGRTDLKLSTDFRGVLEDFVARVN